MIKLTENTYHYLDREYLGVCKSCLELNDSCEPDARNYKCEACGERQVFGPSELLIAGELELVETEGEANVRL